MHVELVDLFRCTQPHESSWLVAAAFDTHERDIVKGLLGCPICSAEYPIHDGVVDFRGAGDSATRTRALQDSTGRAGNDIATPDNAFATATATATSDSAQDAAFRLAALLDLDAPGRTVALIGYTVHDVAALVAIVPTRVVLVERTGTGADETPWTPPPDTQVARVRCDNHVPIASASLHAIATRESVLPSNAVELLRANGRIVAPVSAAIPDGANEIARDQHQWLAAREAIVSTPVQLRRHPSR